MAATSATPTRDEIEHLVARRVQPLLISNTGAAVAVRIDGRTVFFNYGWADHASGHPVTSDSLFNLASVRKVFEAVLLAEAANRGELSLDDPVAKYVTELQHGQDIRRVTLGQLATHTSGLLLPQDHPPWPDRGYTLPEFIDTLNRWREDDEQAPGKQHIYTHAGYVLLQLALERRFGKPIAELLQKRIIAPLGLHATMLPPRGADGRAKLPPDLMARAVQGYSESGERIGEPGDQQTYYHFPGTGQMYSSARDLAVFVAANLGELRIDPALAKGMRRAQQDLFAISPKNGQGLAWEINYNSNPPIVEKNGGLNNSSTYLGLIPERKLGLVILTNRGNQNVAEAGRLILNALSAHE
ncbi:MAG TPA: serine hydrolase [Pseudolabrys sp.]|nr:serine hydrolase [Pseudolabrys sp.]